MPDDLPGPSLGRAVEHLGDPGIVRGLPGVRGGEAGAQDREETRRLGIGTAGGGSTAPGALQKGFQRFFFPLLPVFAGRAERPNLASIRSAVWSAPSTHPWASE